MVLEKHNTALVRFNEERDVTVSAVLVFRVQGLSLGPTMTLIVRSPIRHSFLLIDSMMLAAAAAALSLDCLLR